MEQEGYIIRNLMASLPSKDMIKKTTMSIVKNNKTSEKFRKEGNHIFNNQLHDSNSHEQIWKLYSNSVALAEVDSEYLALAYGNRSAILLHMSKYKDSLIDIDRALDITVNNCLRIKLLIRKAKCLHALGLDESKMALTKAESLLEKIEVVGLKKLFIDDITATKLTMKKPFQPLETPCNRKSSAIRKLIHWHKVGHFDSVDIMFDKKYGRYLIATKDIKAGEILYNERPSFHCVNTENIHVYCYHCLTTTWTSVPCKNCTWTMFCSENCREEAWEQYHSIECSMYSYTTKNLNDSCTQLAIKALCFALKQYGGVKNLRVELSEFDKFKSKHKGFLKNNKICTSGFKTMYILSRDVTRFTMERHEERVTFFLDTLSQHPELLAEDLCATNVNEDMKRQNIFFLCSLFLRLSTVSEINKLEMWNESYKCPNGSILKSHCCKSDCCSKGVYIAPVTSLINHSCYPNVSICYTFDNKAVVYALRPIKAGEQILRCYQEEFFFVGKLIRKHLLNNMYNFQCNCEACLGDWTTLLLKQGISTTIMSPCLPTDVELQAGNKRTINLAFSGTINCNVKIIESLGKDIGKALKNSSKPTLNTVNLIRTLSIILTNLYGITLSVPSNCNSEITFI